MICSVGVLSLGAHALFSLSLRNFGIRVERRSPVGKPIGTTRFSVHRRSDGAVETNGKTQGESGNRRLPADRRIATLEVLSRRHVESADARATALGSSSNRSKRFARTNAIGVERRTIASSEFFCTRRTPVRRHALSVDERRSRTRFTFRRISFSHSAEQHRQTLGVENSTGEFRTAIGANGSFVVEIRNSVTSDDDAESCICRIK